MTIGSDFYLVVDRKAHRAYVQGSLPANYTYAHGTFSMTNGSAPFIPVSGVLAKGIQTFEQAHIVKGRDIFYLSALALDPSLPIKAVFVTPRGIGHSSHFLGGLYFSSFPSTQLVPLYPIFKPFGASNFPSW